MMRTIWTWLQAEAQAWQTTLHPSVLTTMLIALFVGLLLAVQLPLSYRIDVGVHEGYGGDLPLLWGFNTPEDDEHGTYRWTRDGATIRLPGVGQRPLLVRLAFNPISAQVADVGPETFEIWIDDERFAVLPVYATGNNYTLLIPPHHMQHGMLELTIHTATFTPPDDPRNLGTPLDRITVFSTDSPSLVQPAWGAVFSWLLVVVLCWSLLVRAFGTTHLRWIRWFTSGAALLILLAAVLDPPRWGYGAQPAAIAAACAFVLLLLLRPLLPPLMHRLDIPLGQHALGWLLSIAAIAFGIRLGGRLFPLSMWGDIGFHANRFIDTFGLGEVFLVSRNRGVNFPYPPGTYLTLAPLVLLDINLRLVLQFVATLLDGLSAILIYIIVGRGLGGISPKDSVGNVRAGFTAKAQRAQRSGQEMEFTNRVLGEKVRRGLPSANPYGRGAESGVRAMSGEKTVTFARIGERSSAPPMLPIETIGILAAALYVFTAAGIMLTWWSFATHIYTQCASLVLITGLMVFATGEGRRLHAPFSWLHFSHWRSAALILGVIISGVFLGHFGFLINVVLMGGLLLAIIWLAAWRGNQWAQQLRLPLTLAYMGASVVSLLFFYTAYIPLFIYQFSEVSQGGLTELADRAPVSREHLWNVLWNAGFIEHFGFFPLLLIPVGIWRVWVVARGRGTQTWGGGGQRGLPPANPYHGESGFGERTLPGKDEHGQRGPLALFMLMVCSVAVSSIFAILPFITLSTQSTRWMMFSAWVMAVAAALAFRLLWRYGRVGRIVVLAMGGFVVWNSLYFWLAPMLWRIRPPEPF